MYKVVCINNVNDKQILSIDEKKYNVDEKTIRKIKNRTTWKKATMFI